MELLNATRMEAGYTLGMEPSGRENIVVAVKGSFAFPADGGEAVLAETQAALVEADEFTSEPGFSAPLYEVDYAPFKPRCDVLLNATAHAPHGRPATEVQVGVRIGRLQKSMNVVGDRVWGASPGALVVSRPRPFETMPISYDVAFGGSDTLDPDASKHGAYAPNPVGRGYHESLASDLVDGTPLPNTEEIDRPVTSPSGRYNAMSFGALGRGWPSRLRFAGTYDGAWIDEVFPFLPADFDPQYYQAAPLDQQIPYPRGGEEVLLHNLTPEGRTTFRLPTVEVPVEFTDASYERSEKRAELDTIVIEPDARRLMLTWRTSLPLKRNMLEMRQVVVGRMSRAWYRSRDLGKTYYPSLGALVRERRDEFVE